MVDSGCHFLRVIIGIASILFAPMVARFGRIAHYAMRACKEREINSDSKRWIRLRCFKVIGAG